MNPIIIPVIGSIVTIPVLVGLGVGILAALSYSAFFWIFAGYGFIILNGITKGSDY